MCFSPLRSTRLGRRPRCFGVVRLYVFGSSLRDDFRPGENNIDLLVELGPDESYTLADTYFGLLDEPRDLLGNVDLVIVEFGKNPYIAGATEQALAGMDLAVYWANRLVRSAVEREFIITGEAKTAASGARCANPPSPLQTMR